MTSKQLVNRIKVWSAIISHHDRDHPDSIRYAAFIARDRAELMIRARRRATGPSGPGGVQKPSGVPEHTFEPCEPPQGS